LVSRFKRISTDIAIVEANYDKGGGNQDLTPSVLRARDPLIAKIFYLAGFIEQYGSGTIRMVEWMKEAGLPEPEYREELGGFSVYFYKDIYTEDNLRKMELNERQIKAVMYVKEKEKIANREYQELCNTSERTATRDLSELVKREIFEQVGITGKGTNYILKTPQRRQRRQKDAAKAPSNQKSKI
jgi:predicted HTH transcriptional regulator